ncbi:hypothetical protein HYH02_012655 [Chlamydomonas schloesseri]|uniref:Peptidase C1A papain C-terminal domain-containing protein n=1 Tax=Chlamydomonas schloesseri TaxID=2026947 RepID=A0A835SUY8_9CHLO|nr:hypothetical protein HYH02_012655 [Chlamydomonas schloesseri]|eukprot:KAG2433538.1 hypothetical protein HYH02_012655 [Chlamydomonas schloesseri]
MPLDLRATFPGPHTTATPSIVPRTDATPVPSPSPIPDGATDDRQAELPAQPRPLASPRPPPRAPAPPLVPPPGTTSGVAWPLTVPSPLPPRWDSRDRRLTAGVSIISRVRFQASCNACVAFTAIAAAESAYALGTRHAATNLDFSEQALFFCNADIAARPPDCYQGWVLPDALQVLSQRGIRQERCYVYDVTRGAAVCGPAGAEERETLPGGEDASANDASSSSAASASGGSSSSSSTSTLSATDAPSVCDPIPGRWEVVAREWYGVESANATAAKEVVVGTGSAMTCFKLYADMYSHPGGVYRWDGESAWLGWHCAQLVGWSDDGGWWLFKSSWGTEVADRGFFKVAYGEAEVLAWGVYGLIWRP